MLQKGVVIGKAPAHFFNCSSSWPSQAALFLLLSPGTDEAFFFKCGCVTYKKIKEWTFTVQYITLPASIYGNPHVIMQIHKTNEIFWGC